MRYRYFILSAAGAAIVALAAAHLAGQAPGAPQQNEVKTQAWTPPRTAWGDPDLQGMWRDLSPAPLQRPTELAGKSFLSDEELAAAEKARKDQTAKIVAGDDVLCDGEVTPGFSYNGIFFYPDEKVRISRRTSAIIDPANGRLPPWTPAQVKRWEAREQASRGRGLGDSWEDRRPGERCINTVNTLFDPTSGGAPAGKEILQAPGYVAMVIESHNGYDYRIIPLDGRPALGPSIRQWLGDARGHWEGSTLVVEITNVNDKQDGGPIIPVNRGGMGGVYPGSGETLRVIERWTRVGPEAMEYRYAVVDPQTYAQPYTVLRELTRDDQYKMYFAAACHEGNSGLAGQLASSRADEQGALQAGYEAAKARQKQLQEMKAEWQGLKNSGR